MSSALTEMDRRRIIDSVCRKPKISPENFLERVEGALAFYSDWQKAVPHHRTKYGDVERRFGRLRMSVAKLNEDLTLNADCSTDPNARRRIKRATQKLARSLASIKADPELYEHLRGAAETVADREGCLPDYDAEQHPIEGFSSPVLTWPVERQLDKASESKGGLRWLERVTRQAESSARTEIELRRIKPTAKHV